MVCRRFAKPIVEVRFLQSHPKFIGVSTSGKSADFDKSNQKLYTWSMTKYIMKCSNCKRDCTRRKRDFESGKNTFCTRKCEGLFKRILTRKNCSNCNKVIERPPHGFKNSKSSKYYCSRSCAVSTNNKETKKGSRHPNWKNGIGYNYRKKVIESVGLEKCKRCDWDKRPEILQIHHKDRDRRNNELSNLEILCPNCHTEDHFDNKDGLYNNLN